MVFSGILGKLHVISCLRPQLLRSLVSTVKLARLDTACAAATGNGSSAMLASWASSSHTVALDSSTVQPSLAHNTHVACALKFTTGATK